MPIKKKLVSELTPVDNLSGLYALGVKFINGVQTSVKVSFELFQKAYSDSLEAIKNAVSATNDAKKATSDMRELEATVEGNEEEREKFYSSSKSLVQGWSNDEQKRKEAEASRVLVENKRVDNETGRIEAEIIRVDNEDGRIVEEQLRKNAEAERKASEIIRQDQEEKRETGTLEAIIAAEAATNRLNDLSDHRDEIREGYWWRWNEETGEWYNTGEIAKGNVMYATFDVDENNDLYMFTDEEYTGPGFIVSDEDLYVTLKTE